MPSNIIKRGSVWYFKKSTAGKVIFQSLRTGNRSVAQTKARLLSADLEQNRWDRIYQLRTRRELATLGEIIARYELATDLQLVPRTLRENVNSLRRVIRRVTEHDRIEPLSVSILDSSLVKKYLRVMLDQAGPGELDRDTAAVTANSTLTQARSIFSKRALRKGIYEGLSLGDLRGFLEYEKLHTLPRNDYHPPKPELISKVWAAAEALKASDPSVWLAFWLAGMTGLRKGEIIAGRWSWISDYTVSTPVTNDFRTKSGRERTVPVIPEVRSQALAVAAEAGWPTAPEDHWLPGSPSDKQKVFRRLGVWLKSQGWERRQKAHELRKVFGSALGSTHDAYSAQLALGHAQITTTMRYVARPQVSGVNPGTVMGIIPSGPAQS